MDSLIKDIINSTKSSGCENCSLLFKGLPFTCQIDYQKDLTKTDVVFVSDSYTPDIYYPGIYENSEESLNIIDSLCKDLGVKYTLVSASKCPSLDLEKDDIKICRKYITKDISILKPKLIITLGELAVKMLLGPTNLATKRGSYAGTFVGIPVVPTYCLEKKKFDPFIVINDIFIAIRVFLKGNKKAEQLDYTVCKTAESLKETLHKITKDKPKEMSVDIETEGLDFINHKITTISFSTIYGTAVTPVYHKDATEDPSKVIQIIKPVLEDPSIRKVFHNADFDWKFLKRAGIHTDNVGDTMLMSFLSNENYPRKLVSLVRRYFPEEIDEI